MPTFKDLVDEVKSNLIGYTLRQDRITYIINAGGISTTDTEITIGSSNNLAKGVVEIDDELLWIDSFDKTTSTLNVAPNFGRGYMNTTPSPHSINSQLTIAPTFPRVNIKNSINDTINSLYPKLWSLATTSFTFNPVLTTYGLPDDCLEVVAISWQSVGPSKEWIPVKRWRFDPMANAAAFNTNSTITIHDYITPGRTVQVWYKMKPVTLSSNSEEFTDVTGLPDSCKDVVVLGSCYRLLSFLDAGRINLTSAEADSQDSKIPTSAGQSVAKFVYALYQQRLAEEQDRLNKLYPIKPHYIRQENK